MFLLLLAAACQNVDGRPELAAYAARIDAVQQALTTVRP
jgi:hypothetical protein